MEVTSPGKNKILRKKKSKKVVVIKTPANQFKIVMNQLSGSDNKILERKINSVDVTGEAVNTRLKFETKKECV